MPVQDSTSRITLHGNEMSYVDAGHGPVVVFVHGLMSSHRIWSNQIDRLSRRYRVLAPDLFGHGESDKPVGDYSLGAHAASLRDLLAALDIPSATLVGHSLGGGISMQFAYLFPDLVDGIALVSTGGLGPELNPLLRAATLPGSEFVLPVLASGWLRNVGDVALNIWSRTGLPKISPSASEGWRSLTSLADGDTRRAFLATSRSVIDMHGQTVSAQNRLGGIASLPTLLVWGGSDRMIPSSHVEAAREMLPASHIEIFDRSGHFPNLDEPERFADVLEKFMLGQTLDEPVPGSETSPAPARGPADALTGSLSGER